ncbi:hypothetical protein SAMN05421819_3513 [Bryocella elongata]|uniref:Tetratricopeptide repeat-containing protein n=1 Tax=Bryocella elongata TaxID=863522 RepID=A0A1H6B4Y6_9BACT|nr:hypothetical protein [Bryocella elongata]SEG55672.1 hypothetical protein SAMN05421819_3513 [Bryocella elongata]
MSAAEEDRPEAYEDLMARADEARVEGKLRLALALYRKAADLDLVAGAETRCSVRAMRFAAEMQALTGNAEDASANARAVVRFYLLHNADPRELAAAWRTLALAEESRKSIDGEWESRRAWINMRELNARIGDEAAMREADAHLERLPEDPQP